MPRRITRSNPASGSDTDVETDTETDRTVVQPDVPTTDVPSPNVAMSEAMLHNLVSSIARSQADANRVLIESILASNRDQHSSASSPRTDPQGHTQRSGNFAKCTARFDGRSKDADELEAFIDAIEVFRDCTNISDDHALRGLPMLLVGEAAVWWQGVKSTVTSWSEALQRLRGMFGVPRPVVRPCEMARAVLAAAAEEERLKRQLCLHRRHLRLNSMPTDLPEREFVALFRLRKQQFFALCEDICPKLRETQRNTAVRPEIKVLSSLMIYAHGSYQRLSGTNYDLGLSQTTVSDCLSEVTEAMNSPDILRKYIKFPTTQEQREVVSRKTMHYHPVKAGKMAIACVVLHNLINDLMVIVRPDYIVRFDQETREELA